jgi:BirA family biotin operon repressor/biotin-[acetyl-CoA-carboxylase] ligase
MEIAIKWPNDLMADDRKLGGILCEARWSGDALAWVVAGVGLNVRNAIPGELGSLAVSLAELGDSRAPADLAPAVASAVAEAGSRIGPLAKTELADFAARDWLRGRMLIAPAAGRADGVEPDGALRVVSADGAARLVRTGPVVLAPFTLHA